MENKTIKNIWNSVFENYKKVNVIFKTIFLITVIAMIIAACIFIPFIIGGLIIVIGLEILNGLTIKPVKWLYKKIFKK